MKKKIKYITFETKREEDGWHSPPLGVPEPKVGCWVACCPNTEGWVLLVTEPKAEGAGWEPAENNAVDSDPKLGALGWLEPGLGPNAGGWPAPKAGPAAGAGGPEPNRNEDDDPWGTERDVSRGPFPPALRNESRNKRFSSLRSGSWILILISNYLCEYI